jgi:hypothetical protein
VIVLAVSGSGSAAAAFMPDPRLPMAGQFVPTHQGVPAAIRLAGQLPTRAAGERVVILARECNARFDRQVRIARTFADGRWQVELGGSYGRPGDWGESGISYRARWKGRWSVPFVFRSRIRPFVHARAANRVEVRVGAPLTVDLRRKPIVLERGTGDGWVRYRTARLALAPNTAGRYYRATFVLGERGLRLRVLAPLATARPCFNPGASDNFTS